MVINVYSQYFKARATFSGVERRGALVLLISDSEAGTISYKAAVSFFPHRDPEDFSVSYDAYLESDEMARKRFTYTVSESDAKDD